MKLESLLKTIKTSLLIGALSVIVGCATAPHLESAKEKKSDYLTESSEKLWLGVTSPFMAVTGLFAYEYTCPMSHSHSFGCYVVEGNIPIRIISGFALLGEGAYNLIAAPFPLPSAGPLMKETVVWAQDNISTDAERYKNRFVRFYTPYGDFYSPYDEVKLTPEQKARDEKWKQDFYEYYKEHNEGKVPEGKLRELLEKLP